MRVRITRNTIAGGVAVEVGQIIDIADTEARTLLSLRKAIPAEPAESDRPPVMTTDAPETAALVATETTMRPRAKQRKGT